MIIDVWVLPTLKKLVVASQIVYLFYDHYNMDYSLQIHIKEETDNQILLGYVFFMINLFTGSVMFIFQVRGLGETTEKPVMVQWILATAINTIFVWLLHFESFVYPSYRVLGISPKFIT